MDRGFGVERDRGVKDCITSLNKKLAAMTSYVAKLQEVQGLGLVHCLIDYVD